MIVLSFLFDRGISKLPVGVYDVQHPTENIGKQQP